MTANRSDESEVVVITGATAGVGRATTRAFAKQGARIGLLARGTDRLEATKQEVDTLGGEAVSIPTDVADAEQVESAAETVEETFGPIDVWINNAMTSVFAEFTDIEPEEYRRVTDVVYHGTVYGTKAALNRMLPRDSGSIVLVGSALAYRGIPLQSAYCGAKHAIEGMFDSVRSELLHNDSNVQMTMVQLPAVNTPQFEWVRSKLPKKSQPVPPIYQPEVAADAILWSAHHNKREISVGYSSTRAIFAEKFVPGLADRFLAHTGYEGQMQEGRDSTDRPDNLWDPVPGDRGARGSFDDRARTRSPALWFSKNKRWLAAAGAGLLAFAGAYFARRDSE